MTDEQLPILVVDDEADLRRLLEFNLKEAGFSPTLAENGADGLAAAEKLTPAVVILDLMLPDIPGTEVCRRMRLNPKLRGVGILMLTARNDDYDRVVGFELGCDDYVTKPFNVREVLLRVRALARRVGERQTVVGGDGDAAAPAGKMLKWRGLHVDTARHRVTADDEELTLRPLEFRLLEKLLENVGQLCSRKQLLEEIWGAEVNARTVDTQVKRLRQRLGVYGDAIETVVGFGYRFKEP